MSRFHRFHRCEGCGDPGVEREYRLCGSCSVLLDGLEDATVPGPPEVKPVVVAREPGDDDIRPKAKPRHDGKWLVWACKKRGKLRQAQAIGKQLGLQRDLSRWTVDQVDQVVAALVAAKTPR